MGVSVGPGATIAGRYRLESPIGEGGFGAVFRATDLRSGSPVAVKILMEGAVESGARFRREAELAMRLSHPNTVRTHDAGEDPGSGLYIVLELLQGGSLEQVLRAHGGFGARRAAEIALAVLGSLREAHAVGIVHRDIKPANVFLQRVPAGGVKVLDFGIAKSTNEGTRAGLTREGQTIGTPAYMAPEQVKGAELGPETDLYALGLVLAEAVSGKPVYATDNGLAVLVDKLNGADPKLPALLVGTPLEPIVRRATRHNREDRYRSAEEMSRAIEAMLGEMPASSESVGSSGAAGGRLSSTQSSAQAGVEWGTESMPLAASSSSTADATAETYGMDIPTLSSAEGATSAMDVLSSAPTAVQESLAERISSASELPGSAPLASRAAMSSSPAISAPAGSAPIASAPAGSGPAASAPVGSPRISVPVPSGPVASASSHSVGVPSGPAFSKESDPSPYQSPFARPAPTLPPDTPKKSRVALGCVLVAITLALAGVAGVGYLAYHLFDLGGSGSSKKKDGRRSTATPPPGGAIPAPAPVPAPPSAPRAPAVLFTCAGLPQIDVMNINQKVNSAPGYQTQDQIMSVGTAASVELTMKRNGADAGRLVFIDGAAPGALSTQEAVRKPEEPDAIYAVKGAKLLYIAVSMARAQDLLPSLCGGSP